jgi:hypothetical protein
MGRRSRPATRWQQFSLCGGDPTFGLLRPFSRLNVRGCQMQFRLRIYDHTESLRFHSPRLANGDRIPRPKS